MEVVIAIVTILVFLGLFYLCLKLYKALIEGKFENKKPD